MNNTYLGNFVINESNIEQYDNGFYRLKHMDTLLLMRDKVLNRGKRLFAKIQSCNINKCMLCGKMIIEYYQNRNNDKFNKLVKEYFEKYY